MVCQHISRRVTRVCVLACSILSFATIACSSQAVPLRLWRSSPQRRPPWQTRWMAAYLRGVRDYNDAFRKNIHRPQTVDGLAGDLSIKPTLFDDMGFMHIHPDGKVNLARMEELMLWYVKMGYLSSPVDLGRSVDPSFADAAVTDLVPYQ